MNQGKLEVVKQEMARVNVDILEISELKWTGMGEFKPLYLLLRAEIPQKKWATDNPEGQGSRALRSVLPFLSCSLLL